MRISDWSSDLCSSDLDALTDAAKTCGQALQLSPDDPVVQVSHAHFLRLTGRSDAAVALYQKVLKANPSDADALAGLAETWMHEFRQSGDRHVLETAMDAAQKAGQADRKSTRLNSSH